MSFLRGSVAIPAIERPSVLYRKLFASESDRQRTDYLLRSGRSSLDFVLEHAKSLGSALNAPDRAKLEEYFTSIRDGGSPRRAADRAESRPGSLGHLQAACGGSGRAQFHD